MVNNNKSSNTSLFYTISLVIQNDQITIWRRSLWPFLKIPTLNLPVVHLFDSNRTPSLSTQTVKYNCKPNCWCQQTQGSSILFTRHFWLESLACVCVCVSVTVEWLNKRMFGMCAHMDMRAYMWIKAMDGERNGRNRTLKWAQRRHDDWRN